MWGSIRIYKDHVGFLRIYRVLWGSIRIYRVLWGLIRIYRVCKNDGRWTGKWRMKWKRDYLAVQSVWVAWGVAEKRYICKH